jgi:SAM-dependent methyltransferase
MLWPAVYGILIVTPNCSPKGILMNNAAETPSKNYPLPPKELRFMGEDDAKFMTIGDLCVDMLQQARPLASISSIFDIGCGYGRLAHALLRSDAFAGSYYGFDILPRQIAWCQQALSPHGPYFFKHLNIRNAKYNPAGQYRIQDFDFSGLQKFDVITLYSVFTHLYEEDVRCYLDIAASLLKPDGKLLCTAFLHNASSDEGEANGKSCYPMRHRLNAHTRYFNEQDPLHAISYDEQAFLSMLADSRFNRQQVFLGSWCGRPVTSALNPFQDLVIASNAE